MDPETVGLIFRGVERLIVVMAAFSAIWLGFRLFATVVTDKGSFEGSIGQWQVKLQRIAPGVFFACFGAGILAFSINSPFQSSLSKAKDDNQSFKESPQEKISYVTKNLGIDSKMKARQLILAISKVTGFLPKSNIIQKVPKDLKPTFNNDVLLIQKFRDDLINFAFGDGWLNKYYEYSDKYKTDIDLKAALNPKDFQIFDDIRFVMQLQP